MDIKEFKETFTDDNARGFQDRIDKYISEVKLDENDAEIKLTENRDHSFWSFYIDGMFLFKREY